MKKIIAVLGIILILAGCGEQPEEAFLPASTEMEVAVPVTVSETPLSQEMAMLEGYVVMQDGDVRHNAGIWFDFLERSRSGFPAEIAIAQYISGQEGSKDLFYQVSFDAGQYIVSFEKDGQYMMETSDTLVVEKGNYDDSMEPYDCYEAYTLNDIVLYCDKIAEPDFEGVTEVFLHAKEGDPPVKSYCTVEAVDPILQLLMGARWMAFEPDDYVYGMKLLMTNRDGKELVLELDLIHGSYRYGTQCYSYGEVSDLFDALDIENWPDSVLEEFRPFIK